MNRSFVFVCILLASNVLFRDGSGKLNAQEPDVDAEKGMTVSVGEATVVLAGPTLGTGARVSEHATLLKPLLAGLSMRQFTRNSPVAPVRIKLKYIKDGGGNRVGHEIHLAFVAYAPLTEFSDDKLSERMFGQDDTDGDASNDSSTEVTTEELDSLGIKDLSPKVRYKRFSFELLEKVRLAGVIQAEHSESEFQRRIDLMLDERFQNQWTLLADQSKADQSVDRPYSGGRAWIAVTKLAEELTGGKEAVLIESRIVMHEPEGWFSGSNFLRSKLPLVLQESARNLRRSLTSSGKN